MSRLEMLRRREAERAAATIRIETEYRKTRRFDIVCWSVVAIGFAFLILQFAGVM